MTKVFDLAVVGAGIVGLAHALAAARLGKRVVVFDREPDSIGASVRNFGFVTVSGQQAGECWRRARRSREVWAEVAAAAGIRIEQSGLIVAAQRPEAMTVLEAFANSGMGDGCELLTARAAGQRLPGLAVARLAGAMFSPHELRVESRTAVPRLAAWLADRHGVTFVRPAHVRVVAPPRLETSTGRFEAGAAVIAAGDDFVSLFPDRFARCGLRKTTLQMLRLAPIPPLSLSSALMSDLSLVRYLGYAELPEAALLRRRLSVEQPAALQHGVHLIVVRSGDGSLVVGDSHHEGACPAVFLRSDIDDLILDEFRALLDGTAFTVIERWWGSYAVADDRLLLVDRPRDDVRIVTVTSGTGASTAFAIAEDGIADLFGQTASSSKGSP